MVIEANLGFDIVALEGTLLSLPPFPTVQLQVSAVTVELRREQAYLTVSLARKTYRHSQHLSAVVAILRLVHCRQVLLRDLTTRAWPRVTRT